MSDGMTEGYRMSDEAHAFQSFLEGVATYLKTPNRDNLKNVKKMRFDFGKYSGSWPKKGPALIAQINRLRRQNEDEWAALLADCISERVGKVTNLLKALSPFKDSGIAVIDYDMGGVIVKGEISSILKTGKTFNGKNGGCEVFIVVPL